jgi:hypothetical protein
MDKIFFDLWFTEEGFLVSGSSPIVTSFREKPIASLFELLKNTEKVDNLGLNFLTYILTL